MIQTNFRSIATQLVDIYYSEEPWIKNRMHPDVALEYHLSQIQRGAIKVAEEMGIVLGYVQVFKITQEQVNRLLQHLPFNESTENITSGDIAFIHNLYIDKNFRGRTRETFKKLRKMFLEYVKDCTSVVGVEQKYRERIKLFNLKRS
jgi:hypothetical protein